MSRSGGVGALWLVVVASAAALGIAFHAETRLDMVPCALCLIERWPYRLAIGLGLLALVLPGGSRRLTAGVLLLTMLAEIGLGVVHVGVERHWWPSPLPECAARPPAGDLAGRLASLPAEPGKPCDEPAYLIPSLPVSMAAMNLGLGAALAVAALRAMSAARTRRRWR